MSDITPRFEFRAFAQTFGLVAEKIRAGSACDQISESDEQYLVAEGVEDQNVKARGGKIDIKSLIERRDRLELWEPTAEETLPASWAFLETKLFPALGVKDVHLRRSDHSLKDLIDEFQKPKRRVWLATVLKRRCRFTIDDCPTEIDELLINGAAIRSVAVEAPDAENLLAVIDKLGLDDYENVNYPRAIRRIIGLEDWPSGESYGQRNRT